MKKVKKDITDFVGAGVKLGVGSAVVGGLSSKSGVSLGGGLAAVGGMMPIVGTTMMGGHAMRLTRKMYKKRKR
jgi:hypothetical protein